MVAIEMLHAEEEQQCPALEVEADGQFSCGMLKRPFHYLRPEWGDKQVPQLTNLIRSALGIGVGCSMSDEDDSLHVCTIPF